MFQIDMHQLLLNGDVQSLTFRGAILSIVPNPYQPETLRIFVKYHESAEEQQRGFKVYRTNAWVPDTAVYVGTIVTPHDAYHLFDVSNVPIRDLKITE